MTRRIVRRLALGGLLLVQLPSVAEVPDELLETPLALAFGAPPTIADPMLSPDGSRLIFIQQNPDGVKLLRSLDFQSGEIATLLQGTQGGYNIYWCAPASEIRVLCDLRQGLFERNPDHQRFVAVNVDGTEPREMRQLSEAHQAVLANQPPNERTASDCRGGYEPLRDDPPIDRMPDDPARILLLCDRSAELLDVYTASSSAGNGPGEIGNRIRGSYICETFPGWRSCFITGRIDPDPGTLLRRQQQLADGRGLVRLYRGTQDFVDRWFIRDTAGSAWQAFLSTDPLAFETPFRPVGYGADPGRLFHIAWDADSAVWALYRMTMDGNRVSERVFGLDSMDVELVDTMGKYQRVVSAAFLDGRSRRAIVDPRVAEVYDYVAGLLPGLEIEILDESWDGNRYLARARAPNGAGQFLLVDMAEASVATIGPEYDHLEAYPLAATQTFAIESSSGGALTVHLTLPHAVRWPDPEAPVPAVIVPQTRASHEDVADPHYLTQFLAASGYAVVRVNNRVDAEFGTGWLPERALVGWRRSADDLGDAARFLVDNGIASPERICAAGKGHGAHTALMAAIADPALFACVIGIAGVTDPRATPLKEIVAAGSSLAREDLLDRSSPVRRADELEVPVLLIHGAGDFDVRLDDHSRALAKRLESAGKDVEFIEYPDAMHDIERGPERVDMLTRMHAFLGAHIGPPPVEAAQ